MPIKKEVVNIKWNKNKIIEGVKEVIVNTGLVRMPTNSEVIEYYGNYELANAISKRRLWYKLAEELGLELKDSETTFGKKYEMYAQEELIKKGYRVKRMTQNHPYDLLVNEGIKIDVKVSKLYEGKNGSFYSYNLYNGYISCDILMLYLVNEESTRIIIIPSCEINEKKQISVGEHNSKYYKYLDSWKYIEMYDKLIYNIKAL